MKNNIIKTYLLTLLAALSLSTVALAQEIESPSSSTSLNWELAEMSSNLLKTPIGIAASPVTGDFLAVVKDEGSLLEGNLDSRKYSLYYLDHARISEGWKEVALFTANAVYGIYAVGNYFVIPSENGANRKVIHFETCDFSKIGVEMPLLVERASLAAGDTMPFVGVGSNDDSALIFNVAEPGKQDEFIAVGSDSFILSDTKSDPYHFHQDTVASAKNNEITIGVTEDGISFMAIDCPKRR